MQIGKNRVVAIDYTLKSDSGDILDRSGEGEPLSYLHGCGAIIPGLESALEGKAVGDELQVTVAPAEAYGERNEALCQEVERSHFADVEDLAVGMQFRVRANGGHTVITIVEVGEENVTVDGNHQLAGETLHFDVAVREVRDATEEEIAHGHVHAPGGHEH